MGWEPAELLGLLPLLLLQGPQVLHHTSPCLVARDFPVISESGGNKRSSLSPSQFCSLSYISLILPQQSFPPTRTSPSWLPPPPFSLTFVSLRVNPFLLLSFPYLLSITAFPLLPPWHPPSCHPCPLLCLLPSFTPSISPSLHPSLSIFHAVERPKF